MAVVAVSSSVHAGLFYWDPGSTSSSTGSGTGTWNTSAEWWNGSGDVAWGNSPVNDAYFTNSSAAQLAISLAQATTVGNLFFGPGYKYTITGGANMHDAHRRLHHDLCDPDRE